MKDSMSELKDAANALWNALQFRKADVVPPGWMSIATLVTITKTPKQTWHDRLKRGCAAGHVECRVFNVLVPNAGVKPIKHYRLKPSETLNVQPLRLPDGPLPATSLATDPLCQCKQGQYCRFCDPERWAEKWKKFFATVAGGQTPMTRQEIV